MDKTSRNTTESSDVVNAQTQAQIEKTRASSSGPTASHVTEMLDKGTFLYSYSATPEDHEVIRVLVLSDHAEMPVTFGNTERGWFLYVADEADDKRCTQAMLKNVLSPKLYTDIEQAFENTAVEWLRIVA